jgi:hypothetical protein
MFVERVMLFRITRVEEKAPELSLFARILLEAGTMSKNPHAILEDISFLEALAKERLTRSEVTGLFSTMVEATESLDARQLYYLLDKLRTEPITSESS